MAEAKNEIGREGRREKTWMSFGWFKLKSSRICLKARQTFLRGKPFLVRSWRKVMAIFFKTIFRPALEISEKLVKSVGNNLKRCFANCWIMSLNLGRPGLPSKNGMTRHPRLLHKTIFADVRTYSNAYLVSCSHEMADWCYLTIIRRIFLTHWLSSDYARQIPAQPVNRICKINNDPKRWLCLSSATQSCCRN